MDAFGYNAAAAAPLNGFNVPLEQRRDGWSPQRDELAELVRRLRARFGRRRLFRRGDVEDIIRELRWPRDLPLEMQGRRLLFGVPVNDDGRPSAPPTPPRPAPPRRRARVEIDLTMADQVVE